MIALGHYWTLHWGSSLGALVCVLAMLSASAAFFLEKRRLFYACTATAFLGAAAGGSSFMSVPLMVAFCVEAAVLWAFYCYASHHLLRAVLGGIAFAVGAGLMSHAFHAPSPFILFARTVHLKSATSESAQAALQHGLHVHHAGDQSPRASVVAHRALDHMHMPSEDVMWHVFLDLDKPLLGILLLSFLLRRHRGHRSLTLTKNPPKHIAAKRPWLVRDVLLLMLASLMAMHVVLALFGGHVWLHVVMGVWALNNFFLESVANGVFYRQFLQGVLVDVFAYYKAHWIWGVALASALAAMLESSGGVISLCTQGVFYFFYGYLLYRTQALRLSIAIQAFVGVVHFFLAHFVPMLNVVRALL